MQGLLAQVSGPAAQDTLVLGSAARPEPLELRDFLPPAALPLNPICATLGLSFLPPYTEDEPCGAINPYVSLRALVLEGASGSRVQVGPSGLVFRSQERVALTCLIPRDRPEGSLGSVSLICLRSAL